jgi:hypothetical protein
MSTYEDIIEENLERLYSHRTADLAAQLPAQRVDDDFVFRAFGESCRLTPEAVIIGDKSETGPPGIIVSLYALQVGTTDCQLTPFKAFREMPDSMPYVGAFASHAEHILVPHIIEIERDAERITRQFKGDSQVSEAAGDFSIILFPLPKIALHYIFYHADDDFPAAATCLFSSNAAEFLPTDALADTGEYTSKKILNML